MDKISEFIKEFRDRLSNQFFSSFIIAWCLINWEIVIGLIFYKITDLYLDGYKSYKHLIESNLNNNSALYYPIICALSYTFAFPFLKNLILAFNAWIKLWGDNWNLKISKNGKIPMHKYMELILEGKEKNQLLEDTIKKQKI